MKNRKKQIATIIIGIAIGVLLAILFAVKKEPTQQPPKKEIQPIKPPKVTSNADARFAIELSLSPEKLSIPPQLPIYQLSTSPMTSDEAVSIATAMGYKTSPFTLNDANLGTVLVWIDDSRTLRIILATQLIDYKSGVSPELSTTGSFPKDQQLMSTAKDFLTQKGILPIENVKFDEIRYLTFATEDAKVTTKEKANIANVVFSQRLNNYPIVNITPGAGNISVAISNGGKILSALIDKTNTIVSSSEYPLKTFSDLKSSLNEAKLQLLDQGNIDITALSSNAIKKIVVQEVTIAYFQENSPTQSLLQPIFILKGTSELVSGQQVSALLYLPAVSDKLFLNQ